MRRLGRGLGSRTLRFGDRGPDVRELHAFLRQQGYDLGEESHFGYLTKDAVRQFQRDHGLVADGIAGRRFFALAQKGDLPIRRRVHVVQPGETLGEIADQYGVGPEAFGSFAGRGIYTGQRLVFFDREVWAICRGGEAPDQPGAVLTGVIGSDPSLAPAGLPCMLRPEELEWDVVRLHSALKTPRRRRRTAVLLSEAFRPFSGACGLYLPWRSGDWMESATWGRAACANCSPGAMLWWNWALRACLAPLGRRGLRSGKRPCRQGGAQAPRATGAGPFWPLRRSRNTSTFSSGASIPESSPRRTGLLRGMGWARRHEPNRAPTRRPAQPCAGVAGRRARRALQLSQQGPAPWIHLPPHSPGLPLHPGQPPQPGRGCPGLVGHGRPPDLGNPAGPFPHCYTEQFQAVGMFCRSCS